MPQRANYCYIRVIECKREAIIVIKTTKTTLSEILIIIELVNIVYWNCMPGAKQPNNQIVKCSNIFEAKPRGGFTTQALNYANRQLLYN